MIFEPLFHLAAVLAIITWPAAILLCNLFRGSEMTIVMPRLVQTPSPNYSSRGGAKIRLIVVHDTEGSYAGTVAWFAQTRSQVSAPLVMREDGGEVTQMVPLSEKAWHACNFNSVSIGIEGAGVEAHGYGPAWWQGMANIVAWLLHAYGLPCRWAQGGDGEGFCSHHDLGPEGGGHNDPCPIGSPDWAHFVTLVEAAYGELANGPLPAWALHGAPAPLAVTPPPAVPPEPSHGGAARNDPAPTEFVPIELPPASNSAWARAKEIVTALRAAGKQNPFVVAALVNAYAESAWTAVIAGDHGESFGPWQIKWAFAGPAILSVKGVDIRTESSLARHVQALLYLLGTPPYKATLDALDAAKSAAEATQIFAAEFERASAAGAVERRVAIAPEIDVWLAGLGGAA